MSGLILKLRPHEQLMINGVVIENGDRKTLLRVKTEGADILRMRNAISPESATTNLKRTCYLAQLAVGGGLSKEKAAEEVETILRLDSDFAATPAGRAAAARLAENDFYGIMRDLGSMIAEEEDVAPESTDNAVA